MVSLNTIITFAIPAIAVVLVLVLLGMSYIKAPPNEAYIISGFRKSRVLIGKAGLRIPFLERVDKLPLQMISIDVKTTDFVPNLEYINVKVDASVKIRIGQDDESLKTAMRNFLNVGERGIIEKVQDTLEGNMREIVGQMKLAEMVTDRKAFAERVQDNAIPDLKKMGLELVAFNVQSFTDSEDVIKNLGIDNIEQIRKSAAIARAQAERDIKVAQAETAQEANEAETKALRTIAERNTDLDIRRAELKARQDVEQAKADAAGQIQAQEQQKVIRATTVDAEIAETERQVSLREAEVSVETKRLEAEVKAKADADLYAAQKQAEAELFRRTKEAEAKRIEQEESAKGLVAVGEAEAAAIKAKALAEAEGIDKKADAMKKYGNAAIIEMVTNVMPQIAQAVAEPLSNVGNITMYGDGNSSKLVQDIMLTVDKISQGLGVDVHKLLSDLTSKVAD